MRCINCGSTGNKYGDICNFCGSRVELGIELSNGEYERKIQIIDTFIRIEDFQKALSSVNELCQKYPDQYYSWVKRAEVHYKSSLSIIQKQYIIEECLKNCIKLESPYEVIQQLNTMLTDIKKACANEAMAYEKKMKFQRIEEDFAKRRKEKVVRSRKLAIATIFVVIAIVLFVIGAGKWYFILFWPIGGIVAFGAFIIFCSAYGICI